MIHLCLIRYLLKLKNKEATVKRKEKKEREERKERERRIQEIKKKRQNLK